MAHQGKKILVAEDEHAFARALELKLKEAGFAVTTVYDGEAATEALSGQPFDLMLLDLVLPKKDGFAVLQYVKDKAINVPVVVLSNLSLAADVRRSRELGAREYFIKSDTPIATLVEYVVKLLN